MCDPFVEVIKSKMKAKAKAISKELQELQVIAYSPIKLSYKNYRL